jgi:hypothetical protein
MARKVSLKFVNGLWDTWENLCMARYKLGFSMNQYSWKLQLENKFQSGMCVGFYKIVFGSLCTNSR